VTVSFSKCPPLASDTLVTTFYPLLENVLQTVCHKFQEDIGTVRFDVRFSVSKARPPLENRSLSHCIVSIGLMDEL